MAAKWQPVPAFHRPELADTGGSYLPDSGHSSQLSVNSWGERRCRRQAANRFGATLPPLRDPRLEGGWASTSATSETGPKSA